jgi:hypothetical protein
MVHIKNFESHMRIEDRCAPECEGTCLLFIRTYATGPFFNKN